MYIQTIATVSAITVKKAGKRIVPVCREHKIVLERKWSGRRSLLRNMPSELFDLAVERSMKK